MGDRCYLSIECHPDDAHAVRETMGQPDHDDDGQAGTVVLGWSEVNYGATDELDALARMRLRFVARNGAGACYGPGIRAVFHDDDASADADEDGHPMVRVPVDPDALASAERVLAIEARVRETSAHDAVLAWCRKDSRGVMRNAPTGEPDACRVYTMGAWACDDRSELARGASWAAVLQALWARDAKADAQG